MRKILLVFGLLMTTTVAIFAQNNSMDSTSYSIGLIIARSLQEQGIKNLNTDDVAAALKDVFSGGELKMTEQEAMAMYQTAAQEGKAAKYNDVMKKGADFLEKNGKREEVTTLPSGLQYEVLKQGNGAKPTASDKVEVHYEGTLLNGKVFDSSYKRGESISFPLNGVIAGWTEGLQHMPVGSKYKLYIPYDLAYGERGAGADIGPYETLIFTVELLGIK